MEDDDAFIRSCVSSHDIRRVGFGRVRFRFGRTVHARLPPIESLARPRRPARACVVECPARDGTAVLIGGVTKDALTAPSWTPKSDVSTVGIPSRDARVLDFFIFRSLEPNQRD